MEIHSFDEEIWPSKIIKLTRGIECFIDEDDYEFLSQWNWSIHGSKKLKTRYAATLIKVGDKYAPQLMHQMLWKKYHPDFIGLLDHKDRDGLNNRKSNIREATPSQNCINVSKKGKNPSSLFKGVYFNKNNNTWRVRIKKDYKQIEVGSFKEEVDAALAYNNKALELFGEFAYLNKIIL